MANEHEHGHHHRIEIRIDHKVYTAPGNPMTGAELRALASIGSEYDLWRERPGPEDDLKVENNEAIHLHSGMHFYISPSNINPGRGDGAA